MSNPLAILAISMATSVERERTYHDLVNVLQYLGHARALLAIQSQRWSENGGLVSTTATRFRRLGPRHADARRDDVTRLYVDKCLIRIDHQRRVGSDLRHRTTSQNNVAESVRNELSALTDLRM